jgi:hypothetical protein
MNKPSIYFLFLLFFSYQAFAVSSFDAFDKKAAEIKEENTMELLMTCENLIFGDVQVGKKDDTIRYHTDPPFKIIESDIWGKRYIFEYSLGKGLVDFNEKRFYFFLDDPSVFNKCW